MGTRSSETLKEIDQIRASLGSSLDELSDRIPAVAKLGRKAATVALGAGGTGLTIAIAKKIFGGKAKKAKKAEQQQSGRSNVVVKAYPPAAVPIAMLGLAVWAGVRLYEARQRKPR